MNNEQRNFMELLYGKPVAEKIRALMKEEIISRGIAPGLAVILIGNDPASHLYVQLKEKSAQEIGIYFEKHIFSDTDSEENILKKIEALNNAENIHGIIVQVPLPSGFDTDKIIGAIDPKKDADGFHPETVKQFLAGDVSKTPVFPDALLELGKASGRNFSGLQGVAVVNSEYFGSVMLQAMKNNGIVSRMILVDAFQNGQEKIDEADIIFSACGIQGMIRAEHIKEGAIIIDGGIVKQGEKIKGDVDAEGVTSKAGFLSPVPGGVGPVTIACLLRRTLLLSQKTSH